MKRLMKNVLQRDRRAGLAPTGWSGFTLIEVVTAIVVVTIGLTAILGLIPVGLKSARDAADNTLSATIAQDLFSAIRAAPFANVNLSGFGSPALGAAYNLQNPYAAQTTYFDQSGFNPNPATPADDYFKVILTFQAQPPPPPLVTPVLSVVTATVYWPAKPSMTTPPLNQSVFVTEIAQYQ